MGDGGVGGDARFTGGGSTAGNADDPGFSSSAGISDNADRAIFAHNAVGSEAAADLVRPGVCWGWPSDVGEFHAGVFASTAVSPLTGPGAGDRAARGVARDATTACPSSGTVATPSADSAVFAAGGIAMAGGLVARSATAAATKCSATVPAFSCQR